MISVSIWENVGGWEEVGRRVDVGKRNRLKEGNMPEANICKAERLGKRVIPCGGVPQPSASTLLSGGVPQPSASPFSRPWLSGLSHSSSPAEECLSQTEDIARAEVFYPFHTISIISKHVMLTGKLSRAVSSSCLSGGMDENKPPDT